MFDKFILLELHVRKTVVDTRQEDSVMLQITVVRFRQEEFLELPKASVDSRREDFSRYGRRVPFALSSPVVYP